MANRLKEIRQAKNLSMNELTRRSGVSRMTIWKLENGAPQSYTMRTLQKIAHALDTPVDVVFDMNGEVT